MRLSIDGKSYVGGCVVITHSVSYFFGVDWFSRAALCARYLLSPLTAKLLPFYWPVIASMQWFLHSCSVVLLVVCVCLNLFISVLSVVEFY